MPYNFSSSNNNDRVVAFRVFDLRFLVTTCAKQAIIDQFTKGPPKYKGTERL